MEEIVMTEQALQTLNDVRELAMQLRVDSIRCSTSAGSGHPTSSMSAADVMAVLLARHFRYDWHRPDNPTNDHLIFSKGHASPLLYSMFKAVGVISDNELMTEYRRADSRLEGHPTPLLPWVDVATGSLGQGLPDGVGVALAGRYLDELPFRVWVLCGDGEMAEGSIWEALDKASHYRLSNLTAIVDVNRLGQRGPTELGWDIDAYAKRVEGFGCRAISVDGHDLGQIDKALAEVADVGQPTVILAQTRKGSGFSEVEDREGWHGVPLPKEMAERAIVELGGERHLTVQGPPPEDGTPRTRPNSNVTLPGYVMGDKVATRVAFGQALKAVGGRSNVVVLDGEVGNSTHTEEFAKVYPERYFEMFIAEQQMIAAAVGMAVRGYVPFAATFGAFLTRAFDFIRMSAISSANIRLCGSHAGVEIGADGPSQMALEDLAMLRTVHGSTVLYPSDATSTAYLVKEMADQLGVVYMRTTRGSYPVLYAPDEPFPIGGAKVIRSGPDDQVTLVGAGVTLHNCLAAADQLSSDGISARVVDLYSVKPVDSATLVSAADATGGRVLVVEDHHPEGGIGSAVLEAFNDAGHPRQIVHLAVRNLPGSGTAEELMDRAGISAGHIVEAAKELVGGRGR
jgi:transketolase